MRHTKAGIDVTSSKITGQKQWQPKRHESVAYRQKATPKKKTPDGVLLDLWAAELGELTGGSAWREEGCQVRTIDHTDPGSELHVCLSRWSTLTTNLSPPSCYSLTSTTYLGHMRATEGRLVDQGASA